jgi:hypothetical protein
MLMMKTILRTIGFLSFAGAVVCSLIGCWSGFAICALLAILAEMEALA